MLSRIIYRIVSVFFFLGAIVLALLALLTIVAVSVQAEGFHLTDLPTAIWAVIMAALLKEASRSAWRAARYDPLWHDYP
jgi:hypothetical protein